MNKNMEYWDIYDINRQKTGRIMRRNDWHMQPGDYHLTVLALLTDEHGSFLITKRADDKAWAPGQWEFPGGGVQMGETSREAVEREVLEETGIDVSHASGEICYSYRRDNPEEGDNYYVDVWKFIVHITTADIVLQTEESSDFKCVGIDEIHELGTQHQFLHYDSLKSILKRLTC